MILLDNIKKHKFLPQYTHTSKQYVGSDTHLIYKQSLKIMPSNWYYRNNEIEYALNKDRYRAPEFDTIDWANSVVILGCSNVFGLGLHTENTISEQLSKLINKPVINLGCPGSSIRAALHNNVILRGQCTPLAVINVWTHYLRCIYYQSNSVEHLGAWNSDKNSYMESYSRADSNPIVHAYLDTECAKNLWRDTKYYSCSMFEDTSNAVCCDLVRQIDSARDLMHPGILTAIAVAERIAENLCL